MPASAPRDSTLAVVGDGFGSLIVYSTAIYLGFRPEEITIYGPVRQPGRHLPAVRLQPRPDRPALGVRVALPARRLADVRRSSTPGRTAASRRSLRSTRRKYNPGVSEILTEAGVVAAAPGLGRLARAACASAGCSARRTPAHFVLYDEDANFLGRAKHVMLALGHGPLAVPARRWPRRRRPTPRSTSASCRPTRPRATTPTGATSCSGAGIASINEWANALDVGRQVHRPAPQPGARRAGPQRAALPVRVAGHRRLRRAALRAARAVPRATCSRARRPRRRSWLERDRARPQRGALRGAAGRDRHRRARARPGLRVHVSSRHGEDPGWLDVTGVVAGTGFNKSVLTLPLLRRLDRALRPARRRTGACSCARTAACPGLDRAGLAAVPDGPDRQQRDPARRHDRRAEVHRPALRRRRARAPRTCASGPSWAAWACRSRSRARPRRRLRQVRSTEQLA